MPEIPTWFRDKVESGDLGRKTGRGFYDWEDGEAKKGDADGAPPQDLTDRLILPMLNACVECLREGVVEDEEMVDGAMIFATGFAPFRGGPMHYTRTRGADSIRGAMKRLANEHGKLFEADASWSRFD